MIFQGDTLFWPDTDARVNIMNLRVFTIIITYPPHLENIFFICLQLGYSICLHGYAETNHLAKRHSSQLR